MLHARDRCRRRELEGLQRLRRPQTLNFPLAYGISRISVEPPGGVQCESFLRKNPRDSGGFALYQSEKCFSFWVLGQDVNAVTGLKKGKLAAVYRLIFVLLESDRIILLPTGCSAS